MNTKAILRFYRERLQGLDRQSFYAEYETQRAKDSEQAETGAANGVDPTETWRPPARSTALKKYPSRSTHAARGNIVDPKTNRCVGYESALERRCALILMANSDVVDVEEQSVRLEYIDDEGEARHNLLDMRATFRNGDRYAISVKEDEMVERSGLDAEVAKLDGNLSGHADAIMILTERELTPGRADNAGSVLYALGHRDDVHCDILRAILLNCHGTVSAIDLAKLLPTFADGWVAVLCLIYDKVLQIVDAETRLEEAPYVTVNRAVLERAPIDKTA